MYNSVLIRFPLLEHSNTPLSITGMACGPNLLVDGWLVASWVSILMHACMKYSVDGAMWVFR